MLGADNQPRAPLANRGIHHSIIKASGAILNRETGKAFAASA
jgi:hypothetical protein